MINAITVLLQSLHAMPQCSDGDGGDGGDGNDGGDNSDATTTNSAAKSITSGLVNNVVSLLRLIAII